MHFAAVNHSDSHKNDMLTIPQHHGFLTTIYIVRQTVIFFPDELVLGQERVTSRESICNLPLVYVQMRLQVGVDNIQRPKRNEDSCNSISHAEHGIWTDGSQNSNIKNDNFPLEHSQVLKSNKQAQQYVDPSFW
jgi:hypothetical protein